VDLWGYLHAIRKRWWLLPAAIAVAMGLAALVTVRTPPEYATSTTFFVGTPNRGVADAYQGSLLSQQRVKSYATLLSGDRLAAVIARQPGVGLTTEEVQRRVKAQPIPNTVLLQATVTDRSRDRSKLIADVLARQFAQLVESLETPLPAGTPAGDAGAPGAVTVKIEVVAGPHLDPSPVSPRPLRNLSLAALLGLLLGTAIAVLREVTDSTVKTSESLHDLSGAPVLATIPHDSVAQKTPLITGSANRSPRAEALRQLRTNLRFVDVDRPVRLIVITSAVSGEGKSSTAVNLAVVFAEAGQRVLLIDADLRRPKLAEYLGIEGALGLTNVLAGGVEPEDVLQPWGSGVQVLPSGFLPPNPSELLASQQMADLMGAFRKRYDMVIIDSPPLLPVTDGAVLAASADGALLVARAAKTSNSQVAAALRALNAVNARLLGCVFNMAPGMTDEHSHYYYGHHHHSTAGLGMPQSVAETSDVRTVPIPASVPAKGTPVAIEDPIATAETANRSAVTAEKDTL
jgi:capsular exopolysaccharide synthesis family protein